MTNPNSDEEEIVKTMYRIRNTERVTEYIKEPLQEIFHYEGERAFSPARAIVRGLRRVRRNALA